MDDLDPSKDQLYTWEDSWPGWGTNHITFKDCKALIADACRTYKVQRPKVVQHAQRSMSFAVPSRSYIDLQGGVHLGPGGRNAATSLHEAAHHIAYALHGLRIQDHGPTFLGIYLDLLVRAKVAPRVALEASARHHKLKWKNPHGHC